MLLIPYMVLRDQHSVLAFGMWVLFRRVQQTSNSLSFRVTNG